jgi:hypothetical protein
LRFAGAATMIAPAAMRTPAERTRPHRAPHSESATINRDAREGAISSRPDGRHAAAAQRSAQASADDSPRATRLSTLRQLVDRGRVAQLGKVTTITGGRLNVVGERHDVSGGRRDRERAVADRHGLQYKLENEAEGTRSLISFGADQTFGDPPWLRAINRTQLLLDALGQFVSAIRSDRPTLIKIAGPDLSAALISLNELLTLSFWERTSGWWEHRKTHYRGTLHRDDPINEGAFESSFLFVENSHVIATALINAYNHELGEQVLTPPAPMGPTTGRPLVATPAAGRTDPQWSELVGTQQFAVSASFGLTARSFEDVSRMRSRGMHEWANANRGTPMLWKVGENHITHVETDHAASVAYDYMHMDDFDKLL